MTKQRREIDEPVPADEDLDFSPHVFEDTSCIFCNVNDLDDDIYGPFRYIEREPYVYTTETPRPGSPSSSIKEGTQT